MLNLLSLSKVKDSINGYRCLKFIESNKWSKALSLYNAHPTLNLNVQNHKEFSFFTVLLESNNLNASNTKIKDELLGNIIIKNLTDLDDLDDMIYIINKIITYHPNVRPIVLETLKQSPNKKYCFKYILYKSFELNDEGFIRQAMAGYKSQSTDFPFHILAGYFNLDKYPHPPAVSLDEFLEYFKDKKVNSQSFLEERDFLLPEEYSKIDMIKIDNSAEALTKNLRDIKNYYSLLKKIGFAASCTETKFGGEPLSLFENCFLRGHYMSVLALQKVFPDEFNELKLLEKIKQWISMREIDDNSILHTTFPKELMPNRKNELFKLIKDGIEIVNQKEQLEEALKINPLKNSTKPLKI